MPEHRLAIAQGPDQGNVLGRVGQVVLAAEDVADLHRLVVNDDHEVVERHAIGPNDHEVAQQRVVELDLAADEVVEADRLGSTLKRIARTAALGLERGALPSVRFRQRPL